MRRVTLAPGGSSGWHSHPDAGVFMVMSGTLLNKGTEPLELTVVYFNVPPGQPSRIDAEAPAECPADLR